MDRNKGLSSYTKPSEAKINLDSLVNFAEKSAKPRYFLYRAQGF